MYWNLRRRWRQGLRSRLEPLRRRFEDRRERYQDLRRSLNQAHYSVTYADYLTGVAVTAVTGALLVGLLVLVALEASSLVRGLGSRIGLLDLVIALLVAVVTGVLAWYVGYTRPRRVAKRRAKALDAMLPSAVSYMYALSHGGLDPVEVVRRTARREDTYGEQAREMGMIVNEMEYLGNDFLTALNNAADLTPCKATSEFLTDMVSVLESGGDFESFMNDRRQEHVAEVSSEQESYMEQLGLFAEGYVTILVAGPLFLIILLMVIGILGASTLVAVNAVIYLGLPAGTVIALVVLQTMSSPFGGIEARKHSDKRAASTPVPDDPDAAAYAKRKRRAARFDRVKNPLALFKRSPLSTLYLTVPLAALAVGVVTVTGLAEPSVEAFRTRPERTTGLFSILPFLIVTVPLAVFYETRQAFIDEVRRRFPDTLYSVARANRSGIDTDDAIRMEAERTSGLLSEELGKLHNDIQWYDDTSAAFRRVADRARTTLTVRTMILLAEANTASGNLHRTLSVAADEARYRQQFAEARSREVVTYVAVAIISFLVFLAIILLVQQFYLERVIEVGVGSAVTEQANQDALNLRMPVTLQDIDAEGFRLAFLHSVLVQGACIGVVAGKLSRGTVLAGVKYSIVMVLVAFAVFSGIDEALAVLSVGGVL